MLRERIPAGLLLIGLIAASSSAKSLTFTSTPRLDMADNAGDTTPVTDIIDTSGSFSAGDLVTAVFIDLRIRHTWVGDLAIELTSPSGTELQILARPGDVQTDEALGAPFGYGTDLIRGNRITFIDGVATSAESLGATAVGGEIPAGSYFPDADGWSTDITSFAGFNGEAASGNWMIRVGDYAAADTGRLVQWRLHIEAVPEPSPGLLMIVGLAGLVRAGSPKPVARAPRALPSD